MADITKTVARGELDGWTEFVGGTTVAAATTTLGSAQSFDDGVSAKITVIVAHKDTNAMTAGSGRVVPQVNTNSGSAADNWENIGSSVDITSGTAVTEVLRTTRTAGQSFTTTSADAVFQVLGKQVFLYDHDTKANCELITIEYVDSGATGEVDPIGGIAHAHDDTTNDALFDLVNVFTFTFSDGSQEARCVIASDDADADLMWKATYELIQKFVST